MPTTLVEITDQLREAFGLTPEQAQQLVVRLVPTLQIGAVSEVSTAASGVNAALGMVQQAAVGGQFSYGQLLNPAASGVILQVFQGICTTTVTTDFTLGRLDTVLATLGTSTSWADFRRSGSPVGQMRRATNAAVLEGALQKTRAPSDQHGRFDFSDPLILSPGEGLIMRTDSFNNTINASWLWREERL